MAWEIRGREIRGNQGPQFNGPGGGAGQTVSCAHDANDELVRQVGSVSGTTGFDYDADGSLTSETSGGVATTYAYDVRNKLVAAAVGGASSAAMRRHEGTGRPLGDVAFLKKKIGRRLGRDLVPKKLGPTSKKRAKRGR